MTEAFPLPPGLPRPVDDGPHVSLPSTAGRSVDLGALPRGRTIIYCYPMTGAPGKALPDGWDLIPGARGCTPQSCGFRDHAREIGDLGAAVFGLSTQPSEYQREMALRLHLPFEVLSDADLGFATALRLPMFEAGGLRLIRRLTLVVREGVIEYVFYPVFPPDESAAETLRWLRANP